MSVFNPTVRNVHLVATSPNGLPAAGAIRKVYCFVLDLVDAYTNGDSMLLVGVEAAIASFIHNGATRVWEATAVQALCAAPGVSTAGTAVYAGTFAVSSEDVSFNITNAAGAELASCAVTAEPFHVWIAVDEKVVG